MYADEENMEAEDNSVSSVNPQEHHCNISGVYLWCYRVVFLVLQVWENVMDITALLRSCVQSAVGMLRDQTEKGTRSTKRVEILLMLLADNDALQGEIFLIFLLWR